VTKNGIELLPDTQLVAAFDGDIEERCYRHKECDGLQAFVAAGSGRRGRAEATPPPSAGPASGGLHGEEEPASL
jgi:hypothetical protein